MSLARCLTAWKSTELTNRMIGASSVASSRSCGSSSSCAIWSRLSLAAMSSITCSAPAGLADFVIRTIQAGQERQAARQHRFDRKAEQQSKVVQCGGFHGIGRRHEHRSILCLEREHVIAAGKMDRNLLDPFMIDLAHIKMRQPGKFKLNGKRLEELIFGNRPESDQDFAETPPLGLLEY